MKDIYRKKDNAPPATVFRSEQNPFFSKARGSNSFESSVSSTINDEIENQLKGKDFESSYELWLNSSMAKELLNKFENGLLKKHKLIFKKITNKRNAQGFTSISAEIQTGDRSEIIPLENQKKIKKAEVDFSNISRFIVSVELMNPGSAGRGAAVLNHEVFLWVTEAASLIENYETTKDKGQLIEDLITFNSADFIEARYQEISKEDSLIQRSHQEIRSYLEAGIEKAKLEGDDKKVSELANELKHFEKALQEEKEFHSE